MGSPGRRRGPLLSTRPRARKRPTSAALKTLSRLRDGAWLRAAGRPLHGQARARRGRAGRLPQVPKYQARCLWISSYIVKSQGCVNLASQV